VAVVTPLLWLCGPPCVGKSVVGWATYAQIRDSGRKTAYVDLAQIGFRRPSDGVDHEIRARNLGALWETYRAEGASCVVVSGGVEHPDTVRTYAANVPEAALTLCGLHASPAQLTERVLLRGRGGGPTIPGDELIGRPVEELNRFAADAARQADELAGAGIGDLWVDTDGRSVEELASLIRTRVGL
jgi:hypothetical protein